MSKKIFAIPAETVKPNQIVVFPDGKEMKVVSSLLDPADDDIMVFFGESLFVYFQRNDAVKIVQEV